MDLPTLTIENASYQFAEHLIFTKLALELPAGKWVGLLGPSGVGKTTLLRLLAGLLPAPSSTRITTNNDIAITQQVAFMAQTDLLLPWLSALDNALLSVKLHPQQTRLVQEKKAQALTLFAAVGLSHALHLYPAQLSGGMRQRVALVRTLLMDKPIILMDEPFSALDAITRYQLQAVAAEHLQHKSVLFITHDPLEALRLAHTIYVMQGQPATLKTVAKLSTPIPRALNDPQLLSLQASLYQELSVAAKEGK